jgi:deoxyribodipyrimidine photo-lyase
MPTLVWFRSDLRTHDHPALHHAALDAAGEVVGLFIISPEQWMDHDWAGVKVDFILRTLRELSASLRELGIPLVIETVPRFDAHPETVLRVARSRGCDRVYFNREYELNEARRDVAAERLLTSKGLKVAAFHDQCIVPPGELRTGEGKVYTVFTPFKRAMYKMLTQRGAPSPLPRPKKLADSTAVAQPDIPDRVKPFTTTVPRDLWPAGETAALKRLKTFIAQRGDDYKAQRDYPAVDGTSMLSPYLTVGAISTRQCLAAALEANRGRFEGGSEGLATWISELVWRDFYRHIVVGYPRVCMHRAFKPATDRIRWNDDDRAFAAWQQGRTGVPIVDAGMRQLLATGWMHNRVRMIVAMYLTKDLFIDWRRGEQHFMRHLIDGDLASNNGGWQWSASTGTDAAPYFRIFNPVSQSRKFDPEGTYIRRWVPELADVRGGEKGPIHDPTELAAPARARLGYPAPLVDRAIVKDRVMKAFAALPPR